MPSIPPHGEQKLPRKEAKVRRSTTVVLPRGPAAFAKTVLKEFGPEKAAEYVAALSAAVKAFKKSEKE